MIKGLSIASSIGFLLLNIGGAEAAGFNCRYASLPAEVAICQNSYIESLDEQVARIFYGIRDDISRAEYRLVAKAQRRFLARRNACGYNDSCLIREHNRRISEFCSFAARRGLNCNSY